MSDLPQHSAPPSGASPCAEAPPVIAPPIIPDTVASLHKPPFWRGLFNGRVLRMAVLAALAFLASLALLFAEEEWRMGKAWKKCRQELEARGEKLDFQAFIPPPVAPAENFVMTPFLSNNLAGKNPGNPLDARRNHSKLNPTFGNWRMAKPINLAVWSEYYRQGTNYPVSPQPQSPAADVLLALSRYDKPLAEFRAASQRPRAQFAVDWKADPNGLLLPHQPMTRGISQTLALRAAAFLAANRADEALADLRVSWRLMDGLRSEPIVLSFMVRISLNEIALQPVWEGWVAHRWNEAQLAALEKELARFDFLGDLIATLRGERAFGNAMFDHMMRDHAPPNKLLNPASGVSADTSKPKWFSRVFFPSWLYWRNQTLINRFEQEMIENLQQSARQPELHPPSNPAMTNHWANRIQQAGPLNAIARNLLPPIVCLPQQACRAQTSINLARTGCALERFRLAHGAYPETLGLLTPTYLPNVPLDLYVGQPFRYRLLPDGQFALYSVGPNLKDDGGSMTAKDTPNLDMEKGDLVWACAARP